MLECLSYGRFKWLMPDEFDGLELNKIQKDNPEGYILEVNLEYPKELHDFHNDYPVTPEKITISGSSNHCKEIANIIFQQVELKNVCTWFRRFRILELKN